jgi:hypothetical protein
LRYKENQFIFIFIYLLGNKGLVYGILRIKKEKSKSNSAGYYHRNTKKTLSKPKGRERRNSLRRLEPAVLHGETGVLGVPGLLSPVVLVLLSRLWISPPARDSNTSSLMASSTVEREAWFWYKGLSTFSNMSPSTWKLGSTMNSMKPACQEAKRNFNLLKYFVDMNFASLSTFTFT